MHKCFRDMGSYTQKHAVKHILSLYMTFIHLNEIHIIVLTLYNLLRFFSLVCYCKSLPFLRREWHAISCILISLNCQSCWLLMLNTVNLSKTRSRPHVNQREKNHAHECASSVTQVQLCLYVHFILDNAGALLRSPKRCHAQTARGKKNNTNF